MSSRRRRRSNWKKKLKRSKETGSLQVDLLTDDSETLGAAGEDAADLGAGAEPEARDPHEGSEGPARGDEAERERVPVTLRFEFAPPPSPGDEPLPAPDADEAEDLVPEPQDTARRPVNLFLPEPEPESSPPESTAAAGPRVAEATPSAARDHGVASHPAGEPLARAKDLVQRGRVQEAIDLYIGILTVNPSNLKARNNLGVLLDELKQYEAALEHLEAAERLAPENVEVLTNLASTLTSVAQYDRADAMLRRAQKIDPESVDVRLAVGILFFRRGLYGEAEMELRGVCAKARDNGPAFYYRGEALNRLGRFEEAGQAMEQAKVLLPNDPRPYYTLGHLYDRKHQTEEAAEMYRQARRLQTR